MAVVAVAAVASRASPHPRAPRRGEQSRSDNSNSLTHSPVTIRQVGGDEAGAGPSQGGSGVSGVPAAWPGVGTSATQLSKGEGLSQPRDTLRSPRTAPPHAALVTAVSSKAAQLRCVRAGLQHRQPSTLPGEEKGPPSPWVRSGSCQWRGSSFFSPMGSFLDAPGLFLQRVQPHGFSPSQSPGSSSELCSNGGVHTPVLGLRALCLLHFKGEKNVSKCHSLHQPSTTRHKQLACKQ